MVGDVIPSARLRSKGSFAAAFRAVFLAVTLLIALILGCFAIDALNGQSAPASNASIATSVLQADGVRSDASAPHLASGTTEMSCADCEPSGTHLGLAAACVLALLALFVGLYLPGRLFQSSIRIVRVRLVFRTITNFQPRTPSLDLLCISRT